jgi:hypothetical protein
MEKGEEEDKKDIWWLYHEESGAFVLLKSQSSGL